MEWNVIVTVNEHSFNEIRDFLWDFGQVKKTVFWNVLVMRVEDISLFLDEIDTALATDARYLSDSISRIIPVSLTFTYQNAEEFEQNAREIVTDWLHKLAGHRFYVRMHRRGFKGRLSSLEQEQFLDQFIIKSLEQQGSPLATVDFTDPDLVIAVETVGQQAGLSLWAREQLGRYPFLKLH